MRNASNNREKDLFNKRIHFALIIGILVIVFLGCEQPNSPKDVYTWTGWTRVVEATYDAPAQERREELKNGKPQNPAVYEYREVGNPLPEAGQTAWEFFAAATATEPEKEASWVTHRGVKVEPAVHAADSPRNKPGSLSLNDQAEAERQAALAAIAANKLTANDPRIFAIDGLGFGGSPGALEYYTTPIPILVEYPAPLQPSPKWITVVEGLDVRAFNGQTYMADVDHRFFQPRSYGYSELLGQSGFFNKYEAIDMGEYTDYHIYSVYQGMPKGLDIVVLVETEDGDLYVFSVLKDGLKQSNYPNWDAPAISSLSEIIEESGVENSGSVLKAFGDYNIYSIYRSMSPDHTALFSTDGSFWQNVVKWPKN